MRCDGDDLQTPLNLFTRQLDKCGIQRSHFTASGTASTAIGPGATPQNDYTRPQRVRVVNDFLQHQVNRMDWPASSPDMNPIKHLWHVVGQPTHSSLPQSAIPVSSARVARSSSKRQRTAFCLHSGQWKTRTICTFFFL